MPRRTSRPKHISDDEALPEGWHRHDGGPCPVDPLSKPAVMFRMSTRTQSGVRTAASWGTMWEHGEHTTPMDIVAWRAEGD